MIAAPEAPADITATSIVLVGPYDPTLLQPANLLRTGALTDADLSELRYEILAPEVSVLKLPWVRAVAERERLVFSTTMEAPAAEPVRDFLLDAVELQTIKVFSALGINSERHFGLSSEEVWHKLGHSLVPKRDLWDKILKEPGMRGVIVRGERDDGAKGYLNVRVEPSTQISPGVFVHINDHFDADPADPQGLLAHLTDGWGAVMKRTDQILSAIRGFAHDA